MALIRLEVHNVRLLEGLRIEPDPGVNVITGPNASGKTTVLEAIHLLASSKSFRTPRLDPVCREGGSVMTVFGRVQERTIGEHALGLQWERGARTLKVDGVTRENAADLAQLLPVQIIGPASHHAWLQEARARRAMLDWGVFHVEPDFYHQWRRYQRLLQQRNAALKARLAERVCRAWDDDLATTGETLHRLRARYLLLWQAAFPTYTRPLLGDAAVEILLQRGWTEGHDLAEALEQGWFRDRARGHTRAGPHRADLLLQFSHGPAKDLASDGQQKLLVTALRLAQLRILWEQRERHCVLLLDDLPAELDREHRNRLAAALAQLPVQVFVTATDADLIDTTVWPSGRWFHVEQGRIHSTAPL